MKIIGLNEAVARQIFVEKNRISRCGHKDTRLGNQISEQYSKHPIVRKFLVSFHNEWHLDRHEYVVPLWHVEMLQWMLKGLYKLEAEKEDFPPLWFNTGRNIIRNYMEKQQQ